MLLLCFLYSQRKSHLSALLLGMLKGLLEFVINMMLVLYNLQAFSRVIMKH